MRPFCRLLAGPESAPSKCKAQCEWPSAGGGIESLASGLAWKLFRASQRSRPCNKLDEPNRRPPIEPPERVKLKQQLSCYQLTGNFYSRSALAGTICDQRVGNLKLPRAQDRFLFASYSLPFASIRLDSPSSASIAQMELESGRECRCTHSPLSLSLSIEGQIGGNGLTNRPIANQWLVKN